MPGEEACAAPGGAAGRPPEGGAGHGQDGWLETGSLRCLEGPGSGGMPEPGGAGRGGGVRARACARGYPAARAAGERHAGGGDTAAGRRYPTRDGAHHLTRHHQGAADPRQSLPHPAGDGWRQCRHRPKPGASLCH
jgi:hypothetical protein